MLFQLGFSATLCNNEVHVTSGAAISRFDLYFSTVMKKIDGIVACVSISSVSYKCSVAMLTILLRWLMCALVYWSQSTPHSSNTSALGPWTFTA